MENLSIASLNCQGLGNPQKRRDVFQHLKQKNHSVYLLQDTHFDLKLEPYIKSEWGYTCYFASYSSQSRGVAVMFNNNFEFKIKKVYKDTEGNFISVYLTTMNKNLLLVNIYGPNKDTPEFYKELEQHIKEVGSSHVIIGGDWNLALDTNMDCHNYKHVNNPKAREKVEEIAMNLDLIDIWREINPEIRRYTWRRPTPFQQSRLDFFLISENMIQNVEEAEIVYGYRSDHSMITLKLSFAKEMKRKTFWKFNSSLLKDVEYIEEINTEIKHVTEEYAVLVYNQKQIENISQTDIQFTISDQLFLDVLLMKIRSKTIAYASMKKRKSTEKENQLEVDIQHLEQTTCKSDQQNKRVEECKANLIAIRKKKMDGILLRSRARWIAEGEKISAYFCNLEKRHFISKSITKLVSSGIEKVGQNEIIQEVEHFYKDLYSKKISGESEMKDLVNDIPTLSDDEANEIEGQITLNEARQAL